MRMSWDQPRIAPEELYVLLRTHKLLPLHLGDTGLLRAIKATADAARFGLVLDKSDGVLASTLTFQVEPGILAFQWIPEVKKLHTRHDDLIALGTELRAVWFTGDIRRVEARVPIKRYQTISALHRVGFKQETEDRGLRGAVDYGSGPEAIAILGMLKNDPPWVKPEMKYEPQEVVHG